MKRTIEKIVDFAATFADPEKIILFGSMAHGTNDVHSDVDLLIVSDNAEIKREVIEKIKCFSDQLSVKVDVLFCSQSEMAQACQTRRSFVKEIARSGKIVYEKNKKTFALQEDSGKNQIVEVT